MSRAIVLTFVWVLAIPAASWGQTPAEARVRAARERIADAHSAAPRAAGLVALAMAETARARETGEADYYTRALQALAGARQADPQRGDLAKVEAWVRLGRHEFRAAEALAKSQVDAHPEDSEVWGILGDARMELGRTEQAGEAYQQMMNLRPGPGAYLRAAYYRERTGDLEGARLFLTRSLAATGRQETEQRAWTLVLIASIDDRLGRPRWAEARLHDALSLVPDYHYALAGLAKHELEQGCPEKALPLARRVLEIAPHAERWLLLADALRALGREKEARAAEDAFERAALAHVDQPDNENIHLVDFYLDRRPDPPRALAIARKEAARRPDPATLARLARARASARPSEPSTRSR